VRRAKLETVGGIGTVRVPENPATPVTHSAANVPTHLFQGQRQLRTPFAPPKAAYVGRIPQTLSPRRYPTGQRATRPRSRRGGRKSAARGDPSQAEDDPEPVAWLDGFAVASRRMHEHLCRRTSKAAAA
jgi:hypothetical protein